MTRQAAHTPAGNGTSAAPDNGKGASQANGRHVFYRTLIVIGTLAAAYLLYRLAELVAVLFVAIVFASAIRPLVEMLVRRGLRRSLAILLIYIVLIGGTVGLLILVLPPLVAMTMELISNGLLVRQLNALLAKLVIFGWNQFHIVLPVLDLPEQLQLALDQLNATVQGEGWTIARSTLVMVGQFFLVLVMGFYWLSAREPMLQLLLKMSPSRHRQRVERIWTDVERTLGAYIRGQIILMLAVGGAALVGLLVLRVPYALALAVVAGLTEAIPLLGPFLGGIPAVVLGLTVSPVTGLLVAAWYVAVQQVENHVLVPHVMRQNVGLNPLVVILALAAGSSLDGMLGAVFAIPVAGALQVVTRHLLIDPAIESSARETEGGLVLLGKRAEAEQHAELTAVAQPD